jgi:hypothetical protein
LLKRHPGREKRSPAQLVPTTGLRSICGQGCRIRYPADFQILDEAKLQESGSRSLRRRRNRIRSGQVRCEQSAKKNRDFPIHVIFFR